MAMRTLLTGALPPSALGDYRYGTTPNRALPWKVTLNTNPRYVLLSLAWKFNPNPKHVGQSAGMH